MKTLWRRLVLVFALLTLLRVLLPFAAKSYVDRALQSFDGVDIRAEELDLNLWRGAYEIEGVTVEAEGRPSDDPLATIPRIDLSVQWAALLRGELVCEIVIDGPTIVVEDEFAKDPDVDEASWATSLDELIPIRINRLSVVDAEIHYRSGGEAPFDLYATDLQIEAVNLTNIRGPGDGDALFSTIEIAARPFATGRLEAAVSVDPVADPLRFEADVSVEGVEVHNLNDVFLSIGDVDAERGTFSGYAEFAAAEGQLAGYVKPLFEGLSLFRFAEVDDPGDALELFWEGMASVAASLLTNPKSGRLGTKVELRGTTEGGISETFRTLSGLLRNAFITALRPAIDDSVEIEGLEIVTPEGDSAPRGEDS
jgi:hypothetical protein